MFIDLETSRVAYIVLAGRSAPSGFARDPKLALIRALRAHGANLEAPVTRPAPVAGDSRVAKPTYQGD